MCYVYCEPMNYIFDEIEKLMRTTEVSLDPVFLHIRFGDWSPIELNGSGSHRPAELYEKAKHTFFSSWLFHLQMQFL